LFESETGIGFVFGMVSSTGEFFAWFLRFYFIYNQNEIYTIFYRNALEYTEVIPFQLSDSKII